MTQKTILIADDEENIRVLIKEIVAGLGYDVLLASNGQEAFRLATTHPIDLMLLDIMMPDWNGVDAVKSLEFINKKPKVLVVSGYISDHLREELKAIEHIAGYLPKPFKLDELRDRIVGILNEDQMDAQK